MEKHFVT